MINSYLVQQIKGNFLYKPTLEQEKAVKFLADFLFFRQSGAPLNLFQAQTPYETYLGGLNTQELANLKDLQTKLGKYCGLRVGDIEQPNNNASPVR
jgi:hypothetical protein